MNACIVCGHPAEDHQNLIATCACGCTNRRFGATPYGAPRAELDAALDALKHAAATIDAARADADAVKLLPAAAAARVTCAALDELADSITAALDGVNAAATACTYSNGSRVVERVWDTGGSGQVEQINPPPGVMNR